MEVFVQDAIIEPAQSAANQLPPPLPVRADEAHVEWVIAFWLVGAAGGAVLTFCVPVTMWWVALRSTYAARGSTFPWPLHQFLWLAVRNWHAHELPTLPPVWLVFMPVFSA